MERVLPSYPLFVKDPNFSIWMAREELNSQNVETWYGETKNIYGFLKTQEEVYCFMGDGNKFLPFNVKKAVQIKLKVTAFSTDYEFLCGKTTLKIRFVSPLPLDDLELLSMPVCYMEYEIIGDKNAEISIFVNRNIAYNDIPETLDKRVRGGVLQLKGFESAFVGLVRQMPLSVSGDLVGADWGYFYLAGEQAWLLDEQELFAFLSNGYLAFTAEGEEKYIGAINKVAKGAILLGYDDRISIDYFGDYRKGYYLENHTVIDALTEMWYNRSACEEKLHAFENDLLSRAEPYGTAYKNILFASLRQSIGGHKLVKDKNGNILWLSKECGSNGCIGTVDISYPSMPLYLLYNPELVKGMMRPILEFARMPVWSYDFAPHDVGTYPVCGGQIYAIWQMNNKYHAKYGEGGFWSKVKTHFPFYILPENYQPYEFKMQMPVEECANMLIMFLAVYQADKDITFFESNKDLCAKWVKYLVKYGLKPGNQLCTDDFAGHLENNINLAIKATVGIAAYAQLLFECEESEKGGEYRKIAETFATEITIFAEGKTHLPLTWNSGEDTFGLKYNFAFDKILGLNLFNRELFEKEVDYYLSKAERYGVPLDNRKMYTKSDWLLWVARLTSDMQKRKALIAMIDDFLKTSPDRVPFSDWYETQDGSYHEFRARSVQGGCFILLI
jgi:hypothetical protein